MRTASQLHRPYTDLQRALGACRSSFLMVFMFSCGYNFLLLAPPIYLLQIYDRVLSSRSLATLVMLTLIVSTAVVVGSLLDTVRRAALARLGGWLEDRLRPAVLSAAFEFALRVNGGSGSEAYRDLTTVRQFIASPSNVVLFDAPWSLLFLGVLFLVHPLLGAIGAVGALLLLGCAMAGDLLTKEPLARVQAAEASINQRLGAALRNVQAIRAMDMLDGATRLVYRDATEANEAQEAATRRSELLQAISKPARALTQVLIMGTAAWLVIEQHVSAGIIFASSLLLGRGLSSLEGVIAGWKAFGIARNSYRRLTSVMAHARSRSETTLQLPRPKGSIAVENVSYVPAGTANLILQGVTFSLQPGECLGIIGPSGAGKSTLGRMIVESPPQPWAASASTGPKWLCGSMPTAKVPGLSAARHRALRGLRERQYRASSRRDPEQVVAAAKLVGLHETIMRLPRGYDTYIGGPSGVNLSGGQRQSIGLARAFFGSPQVVLLDEPNSSLDEAGEQALYDAVERRKAEGSTIVIITHRLGILDLTDRIAILRSGMLSAFGSSEEIYKLYFKRPELDAAESNARHAPGESSSTVTPGSGGAPALGIGRVVIRACAPGGGSLEPQRSCTP